MPPATHQCRTPHQEAFGHYLRTGERLTTAEWLARQEVKFNPWHDRLGRFTFGPGGVGGAGSAAGGNAAHATPPAPRADLRPGGQRSPATPAQPRPAPGAGAGADGSGFRSDFVRGAVAPQTSNADTYFELNKRQAGLDRLRAQAGPQPSPAVAADLAEFQARLDANRALLDKRYRFADQQVGEILRAGLTPYDVAAGVTNIADGKGELRDYLSVAQIVPVGAVAGKIGKLGKLAKTTEKTTAAAEPKVAQLGGAHRWVQKNQSKGQQAHHLVPAAEAPVSRGKGVAVSLAEAHHKKTGDWGSFRASDEYRKEMIEILKNKGHRAAIDRGIADLRQRFGTTYDEGIRQALDYADKMGFKSWISRYIFSRASTISHSG